MAREIPLTKGYVTVVDDEDYAELAKFSWSVVGTRHIYACRFRNIRMHRVILNAPPGIIADHIDGDTLNNQRSNLRLATLSQNQRNAMGRTGTSRFKGVSWHASTGRWRADIKGDGPSVALGEFDREEEAALAYDEAAVRLHGQFARTNRSMGLLP